MQLKSLKIFCDIVRLGSFSKAAELNGVSQPSASQLVHQLEDRLGVQLIDRSKTAVRRDRPRAGSTTRAAATWSHRYEELERRCADAHASPAGRLRVAAIYSIGLGQMHRVVEEFRAEQPGVDLHVEYMHPEEVQRRPCSAGDGRPGRDELPRGRPQAGRPAVAGRAVRGRRRADHPLACGATRPRSPTSPARRW